MKKRRIHSFDKTASCVTNYEMPADITGLQAITQAPLIARGSGMSYCNASALENGCTVDMRQFKRVLSFDKEQGLVHVEAGICIGELNNYLIGYGWQMPVLPGYPLITVGGCIAFNVHGKAQSKIGLYGEWVEELSLYHPSKGTLTCSPTVNGEVFDLTIGGMGFTGIILSAKLRLLKIPGNRLSIRTIKVANIDEAVSVMIEQNEAYDYAYSWNNFNLHGKSFGRGIVYLEKLQEGFSEGKRPVKFTNRLLPPKQIPSLLNKFTIYWMCQLYYMGSLLKPVNSTRDLAAASFPIYKKEIYYHLFGKRGFREYQVLFSYDEWKPGIRKIKELITGSGMGIALASLKLFKGKTHNISFSGEGVCLAIDIPNTKNSIGFFEELDKIAIEHGAVINLSKDSRAGHELVSRVYPAYELFKKRIHAYDPECYFVSELRNRIKI